MPPGEAASSIMPTASTGGSWNSSTRPKQMRGQQHELADEGDDHRLRMLRDAREVARREGEAEPEHDDAERDGQSDGGQR